MVLHSLVPVYMIGSVPDVRVRHPHNRQCCSGMVTVIKQGLPEEHRLLQVGCAVWS